MELNVKKMFGHGQFHGHFKKYYSTNAMATFGYIMF
jgi:hypothetical protein